MSNKDKLLAYVVKHPDTGCWLWRGQVSNTGYGRIKLPDREGRLLMQSAHRASYELFVGEIPVDKKLVHVCSNRLCVNPDHLRADSL
jgi:hypothetical protein